MKAVKEGGTGPICLTSSDPELNKLIGKGNLAQTKMPNISKLMESAKSFFRVIDCPGLKDSNGFTDEFTNKYFIGRVFEKVKNARYLLCIT